LAISKLSPEELDLVEEKHSGIEKNLKAEDDDYFFKNSKGHFSKINPN
jgi:hypothetical protein